MYLSHPISEVILPQTVAAIMDTIERSEQMGMHWVLLSHYIIFSNERRNRCALSCPTPFLTS